LGKIRESKTKSGRGERRKGGRGAENRSRVRGGVHGKERSGGWEEE